MNLAIKVHIYGPAAAGFRPYIAKNDYGRLWYKIVLLHQFTVIGNEYDFKHRDLQTFASNCTHMNNFHPLEVVGRGSETQLQVGENLNCLT